MKKWLPVLVVVAVLALYASFVNAKLKFGSDSVDYYRLAESIVAGQGYTIDGNFVSKWPPVTPVLIAFGMGVFHAGVAGLKVLLGGLALVGLVIAYFLLRGREEGRLSPWVVVLTAVSFPFIYWVMDLSSEGPYFFWTMAALWLGQLAFAGAKKPQFAVGAGLCIGLAFLSRTVGAAMIGGFVLYSIIAFVRHRQAVVKPILLGLIPALLLAGGWTLYARHQGGESSIGAYSKYGFRPDTYDSTGTTGLITSLKQVKENLKGYAFIFSVPDASLRMKKMNHLNARGLLSLAIMGLAAIGYFWHLLRRPQFAECYLLAYAGILLVFNWYDIRYVVPVLPLLFYYVGWTIQRFTKPVIATCVLALLILANAGISVASQPAKKLRSLDYQGPAGELHDAALWIQQNDPHAVVMCRWANMTWFWTRMKVDGVPLAEPEAMWQHMREKQVTMVIADPDEFSGVTGKYLDPALTAHPDKVELIKTFGQTRVYRIRP